jgi:DNA-directed RNA polymerase delta subunit
MQQGHKANQKDGAEWFEALPAGHLRLGSRARAATTRFRTIGRLLTAIAEHDDQIHWTAGVERELLDVYYKLRPALDRRSDAALVAFLRSREQAQMNSIYFARPSLDVAERVVNADIRRLHLSVRAINVLTHRKISTVPALISHARAGIVQFSLAGESVCSEIVRTLDCIWKAGVSGGDLNWARFAELYGVEVLPGESFVPPPALFLDEFPSFCRRLISKKFGAAGSQTLNHRFLTEYGNTTSLRTLGKRLGLTGERMRIIESEVFQTLEAAILRDEYVGCPVRLRFEFLHPIHFLILHFRRPEQALPVLAWKRAIQRIWHISQAEVSGVEALLLRLLGFSAKRFGCGSLILREHQKAEPMHIVVGEAKRLMREAGSGTVDSEKLRVRLAHVTGQRALSDEQFRSILSQLPEIEAVSCGAMLRVRFKNLRTYAQQSERLLQQRGSPMHYTELVCEIAGPRYADSLYKLSRNIVQGLTSSPRFRPIAKSGFWALTEWSDVETRPVADIAASLLAQRKSPLQSRDLFGLIMERRDVSYGSVYSLLKKDPRFIRSADGLWSLRTSSGIDE